MAASRASHRLFLAPDPAAVSAWCHKRLTPGAVFVAPSSAARRLVLRALAESNGVVVDVVITTPGRLLSFLEARVGHAAGRCQPGARLQE